ncbi:hypothetical protein D3C78_1430690 [compost metagenome]
MWIDSRYSSACTAVTQEANTLRTRRLPATAGTRGSAKWRTMAATMSLSKEVSPSSAMTISPEQWASPAFSEDTRPPRCHLAIGRRWRRGYSSGSTRKVRIARRVARLTAAPSTTGIISISPA